MYPIECDDPFNRGAKPKTFIAIIAEAAEKFGRYARDGIKFEFSVNVATHTAEVRVWYWPPFSARPYPDWRTYADQPTRICPLCACHDVPYIRRVWDSAAYDLRHYALEW